MSETYKELRSAYVCCPVLYILACHPDGMLGYDLKKILKVRTKVVLHSLVILRNYGLVQGEEATAPRLPQGILNWKITDKGRMVAAQLNT